MSGEGRHRSRVGGAAAAEPAAAAARGAPLAFSSQPEYGFSPQPPSSRLASSPASSPAALKQAAANYAASPAGFGLRPEPVASTRAPTPPQPPFSGTPEPPAPRAWTPTKQAAAAVNSPARMSPAEALEREMAELEADGPDGMATATASVQYRSSSNSSSKPGSRPGSAAKGSKPGTPPGPAVAAVSPASVWYKQGYCNSAYAEAAGQALAQGRAGSPAQGSIQPFVAQHNNLMAGAESSTSSSNSSHGGMAKLKDRLVGHGSAPSNVVTAVEAFRGIEESTAVVASSASITGGSGSAAVAQRAANKATRLLATGHASHASRTAAEWRTEFLATLSSGQKLAALQLPGPSNGVVQCYVKRISGLLGVRDTFEVRLEASDQLLAVARRRKKSATSSYLISMGSDAGSVTREDEQLVGKLKANMLGTEYLLRGKGGDPALHKGFNVQLLAVNYKPTINQVKTGPRTMTAIVPVPDTQAWNGNTAAPGADSGQFGGLLACMEAARARELPLALERDLVMLHTMKPHYDPVKEVHYLDFKGRVTKMSLKNFQLVHWDHNSNQLGNDLVMQFGKKGHDEYALDFCYPLSLLQAFALALSSIDSKLCYTL